MDAKRFGEICVMLTVDRLFREGFHRNLDSNSVITGLASEVGVCDEDSKNFSRKMSSKLMEVKHYQDIMFREVARN